MSCSNASCTLKLQTHITTCLQKSSISPRHDMPKLNTFLHPQHMAPACLLRAFSPNITQPLPQTPSRNLGAHLSLFPLPANQMIRNLHSTRWLRFFPSSSLSLPLSLLAATIFLPGSLQEPYNPSPCFEPVSSELKLPFQTANLLKLHSSSPQHTGKLQTRTVRAVFSYFHSRSFLLMKEKC